MIHSNAKWLTYLFSRLGTITLQYPTWRAAMFAPRFLATLTLLLAAGYATAQPVPQLLSVFPPGAKAGDTVEVTFSGHNLEGSEKLLFSAKGFKAEPVGAATNTKGQQGQPTSIAKFKVTVPKDAKGVLDVRVVTKSALTNPRAFVVSNMTDVNETEPNNDVDQAQKIELETTVNGLISTPIDVDFVTFTAKAGQNIVVYCLTSSIDSKLQADLMVSGPDGKPLASNRGYRGGDAVLDFKAPSDGNYVVRVSQFAYTTGGYDHFYRLTVTTKPWVEALYPAIAGDKEVTAFTRYGQQVEVHQKNLHNDRTLGSSRVITPSAAMIDAIDYPPAMPGGNLLLSAQEPIILDNEKNNTADTAQEVKLPCDIAGRIGKKNDRHWYSFTAKKGDVWTLEVFAERIGSPVDAFFILSDEKGKIITEQDDSADTLSPNQFYTKSDDPGRYRFSVPANGTYKVMVSTREAGTQFGVRDQYVLRIAREKPDFRLAIMPLAPHLPDAGTLPKGGAVVYAIFVFRFDGFADAIELTADNLPEGVKCPPQMIGAGQTRGTLVLTAESDVDDWAGFVKIYGKSGELKHAARPFTVTWPPIGANANQPPPNIPMITRMDRGDGLALAIRGEPPFTLTPTETELTAKAGGKLEVTLKVSRDMKFKDAIQIFSVTDLNTRPRGNQPLPPLATAAAKSNEVKVSIDIPNNLLPGMHTLVLRGQSGAPAPKGRNNAVLSVQQTYPTVPILVKIEGGSKKRN